tara:strand:- start:494 stop:1294 length:801 start_codon:yes stop_codon:yes gene_type:complete
MKWGVPVALYAEFIGGLANQDSMQLHNLPIASGKVWFYGPGGRKKLEAILDYYNEGKIPPGGMLQTYTVKVGDFSVKDMERNVEKLRGPNDDGYYHGRCPCCKARGGDTNKDHFYANPSIGEIGCFAGCKKGDLKEALTGETPVQTSSQSSTPTASGGKIVELAAKVHAKIVGNFVLCEVYDKKGNIASSIKVDVPEVRRFANAMVAMEKKRFTIRELVESMGMDWTEIQGNRSVTKLVHPPVKALYGLGEINYYKNGEIEIRGYI